MSMGVPKYYRKPKKRVVFVCKRCNGTNVRQGTTDHRGYPVDDMGFCLSCLETTSLTRIIIYGD